MPKLKYRGTIVVDIDGVLVDFESAMCDAFGAINRHMYSPYDRYPDVPRDLITEFIDNPDNYIDLAPIFGGMLFCRQAHQRGWYVLLVTARDKSLREVTRNWLDRYGVVYNEIIFAKNKKEVIADYDIINPSRPVSIVVDDSVSVLLSMPEKYCVAWQQEWNLDYYPSIKYDQASMKIVLHQAKDDFYPVGAWDIVGKRYDGTNT